MADLFDHLPELSGPDAPREMFGHLPQLKGVATVAPKKTQQDPFVSTAKATGAHMLNSFVGQPIEDIGQVAGLPNIQNAGKSVRQYAEQVQKENPSQINSLGEIVEKPVTAIKSALGNVLPQLPVSMAGAYAGSKAGLALPLPPQGKAIAGLVGGIGGAFLPNYFQEAAEMRGKQHESGQEDMGKAYGMAVPAAALETAGDVVGMGLGKFVPKGTLPAVGDALIGNTNRFAHAAKQAAKGAVIEGPLTEYPQTYLEQVGGNQATDTPEAQNEREVSAGLAALGGGTISGVRSTFDKRQLPPITQSPANEPAQEPPNTPQTGAGENLGGNTGADFANVDTGQETPPIVVNPQGQATVAPKGPTQRAVETVGLGGVPVDTPLQTFTIPKDLGENREVTYKSGQKTTVQSIFDSMMRRYNGDVEAAKKSTQQQLDKFILPEEDNANPYAGILNPNNQPTGNADQAATSGEPRTTPSVGLGIGGNDAGRTTGNAGQPTDTANPKPVSSVTNGTLTPTEETENGKTIQSTTDEQNKQQIENAGSPKERPDDVGNKTGSEQTGFATDNGSKNADESGKGIAQPTEDDLPNAARPTENESAKFEPTHVIVGDEGNIHVQHVEGNVYKDSSGNEYEDDYARKLTNANKQTGQANAKSIEKPTSKPQAGIEEKKTEGSKTGERDLLPIDVQTRGVLNEQPIIPDSTKSVPTKPQQAAGQIPAGIDQGHHQAAVEATDKAFPEAKYDTKKADLGGQSVREYVQAKTTYDAPATKKQNGQPFPKYIKDYANAFHANLVGARKGVESDTFKAIESDGFKQPTEKRQGKVGDKFKVKTALPDKADTGAIKETPKLEAAREQSVNNAGNTQAQPVSDGGAETNPLSQAIDDRIATLPKGQYLYQKNKEFKEANPDATLEQRKAYGDSVRDSYDADLQSAKNGIGTDKVVDDNQSDVPDDYKLTPIESTKLKEIHKVIGLDVTYGQLLKRIANVENEINTRQSNNGGVMVNLRPAAIKKRQEILARLKDDADVFKRSYAKQSDKDASVQPKEENIPVVQDSEKADAINQDIPQSLLEEVKRHLAGRVKDKWHTGENVIKKRMTLGLINSVVLNREKANKIYDVLADQEMAVKRKNQEKSILDGYDYEAPKHIWEEDRPKKEYGTSVFDIAGNQRALMSGRANSTFNKRVDDAVNKSNSLGVGWYNELIQAYEDGKFNLNTKRLSADARSAINLYEYDKASSAENPAQQPPASTNIEKTNTQPSDNKDFVSESKSNNTHPPEHLVKLFESHTKYDPFPDEKLAGVKEAERVQYVQKNFTTIVGQLYLDKKLNFNIKSGECA